MDLSLESIRSSAPCQAQSVIAGEYIAHYCPPQAGRGWADPRVPFQWGVFEGNDCSIHEAIKHIIEIHRILDTQLNWQNFTFTI